MSIQVINTAQKLAQFQDYWHPRIAGELNGQHIKLVKLKGEFVWHFHELEDEMFWVIEGVLQIELRDKTLTLQPGEFVIIPRGTEHKPIAEEEVHLMLFEPVSTVNTGNETVSDRTKTVLEKL